MHSSIYLILGEHDFCIAEVQRSFLYKKILCNKLDFKETCFSISNLTKCHRKSAQVIEA